ncbi:MAG: hypothetical protein H7X80_01995 [bacterium]|nr:hypothetical protein [Candidatus Kapabacteria bacterium]
MNLSNPLQDRTRSFWWQHVTVAARVSIVALLFAASFATASAQLSGNKNIGGASPDYATIDAAIADLISVGVNGPVTFLIASGTYTPPTSGYILPAVTGMSATNTVTFKPAANATVVISGTTDNTGRGIFMISGGDYYIIDGSNSNGGTTRDMTIRQTNTVYDAAIWIQNDADYNVVKNSIIQADNGLSGLVLTLGGMTIFVGQGSGGNDSNLIQNNMVGDVNGTYRGNRAIYSYGPTTGGFNIGTKIIGNDVVNFGRSQTNTFGIFLSYFNSGAIIRGNTVRMTTAANTVFSQAYGLYCNEQLVGTLGNSQNALFEGNRVYGLQTNLTSGELCVGLYYVGDLNTNSSSVRVINNMFGHDRGTVSGSYYGMFFSVTSTTNAHHAYNNSMYLGGGTGMFTYMLYLNTGGTGALTHRNNAYHSTSIGTGYAVYAPNAVGFTSNNNLYEIDVTNAGMYTAYYNNSALKTFQNYQAAASPNESLSKSGNPRFVNGPTGDLHINTLLATPVESGGAPITGVTTDFDGQTRNTTTPDIGADEGNFNGGGLTVIAPNGGEVYLGGTPINIQFSANRPMSARVDFSSDNGLTWTPVQTVNPTTTGTQGFSWTTPDIATNTARIRVVNTANPIEGDTSDRTFRLVQPTITVISPNGGETFYQGDVMSISWRSTDIPSDKRVMLEYSLNNGANWTLLGTNLVSNNSPAVNTFNWTIPAIRSTQALVRVSMLDKPISDQSNGVFQILKSMNLLAPNGGETWFVGDREWIKWKVNRIDRLTIELSTDNGGTWRELAWRVYGPLDSLLILVPNTPTTQALVRIVNADQPSFFEVSAAPFSIVRPTLQVISPNGGEKYEMGESVDVLWTAANTGTLRLDYFDGIRWTNMATGIDASRGLYRFTPPAFPTKLARVRLTDEQRPSYSDASDATFEIMEAPGISIFTPSQDERLMKGSTYDITWVANRVGNVNIEYSPSGGSAGSWQRIASNIPSSASRFSWTVPMTLTSNGKIRIVEVGGPTVAESGIFSIIEPVASVRILRPNGGETYTSGDPIVISWTSALITTVSLQFTSDGGASWRDITGASALPAAQGSFVWTAALTPSTGYRVRVIGGTIYDDSDNNFTVVRAIVPSLQLLNPNGGENFAVDSTFDVSWVARDFDGDVTIDHSSDNGVTWSNLGTAPAGTFTYRWTVPNSVGANHLIRVTGGALSDQSDASFEVSPRIVAAVQLLSPNSPGLIWKEGDTVSITWQATAMGSVDLRLSTDGGATFGVSIARNVPAAPGTYTWVVTRFMNTVSNQIRVIVANNGSGIPSDTSDASFTFHPKGIASIATNGATGGLQLFGAFPNPASATTSIRWSQSVGSRVALRIFEQDGSVVRSIDVGQRDAGHNAVALDASTLAAGMYFYELRIGGASVRGAMTIVR